MAIENLVKKAKAGDQEALVKLIMLERDAYYKLALVFLKNQEDALDALEDMIVILYEKIHGLKNDEAFYSWSKTILVNCCRRQIKNKKRVIPLSQINAEAQGEDKDFISQREDFIILQRYMENLSQKHQEVLKLRYFLDLEYEAIAELLKIPLGTVKSRINAGLKRLKKSYGGEINEGY
ncbi:RNA polymerase sigma factor [Alkaliphilus crotonatoxidans]